MLAPSYAQTAWRAHVRHLSIDRALTFLATLAVLSATATVVWGVAVRPRPYQVGDTVTDLKDLNPASTGGTLVVWVSTNCGPCGATMPFVSSMAAKRPGVRVILAGLEPVEALRSYAARFSLRTDLVVAVDRTVRTKFEGTPTLLILDQRARVVAVTLGTVTTEQEAHLLQLLQ